MQHLSLNFACAYTRDAFKLRALSLCETVYCHGNVNTKIIMNVSAVDWSFYDRMWSDRRVPRIFSTDRCLLFFENLDYYCCLFTCDDEETTRQKTNLIYHVTHSRVKCTPTMNTIRASTKTLSSFLYYQSCRILNWACIYIIH